ncbi:MAG: glycoside hydrolase [Chromatiales bacterium]|nr:glycoside hydrolase [Chromatiales bacterium]
MRGSEGAAARLKVVLCWHMHQPVYRDPAGRWRQPWTYLHAIKDYSDMAAYLEAEPAARAVVNFAPVLLEQIEAYARELRAMLDGGAPVGDPLLAALSEHALPTDARPRAALIRAALRANEQRVIGRFKPFHELVALAHAALDLEAPASNACYLSDAFVHDLVVWYHLAWMGESVRRAHPLIGELEKTARGFTVGQRRALAELIHEVIAGIIARYRALADSGRVELSVTPYAHPIVPLLLDFETARESMPTAPLPEGEYPGGEARARRHIEHGIGVFEQYFGHRPQGCWPSEGAIDSGTARLLGEYGFRWAATGESVLTNTLGDARSKYRGKSWLYRPWQPDETPLAMFFRDDGLSDRIGFQYASWHADDAVANLTHALADIAAHCNDPSRRVVSIILDGENAWEYYPENARYFLPALYKSLGEHPALELTTFSSALKTLRTETLPTPLVAGSWVHGTLATWIGAFDKNRGWDLLVAAKKAFDEACESGLKGDRLAAAEQQLSVCEGSDWFWWLGDYNPGEAVSDFERLYRAQLRELYRLIGVEPPAALDAVLSTGTGTPATGGVMRTGQATA